MQRILLIDDDPSITTAVQVGLNYAGFVVDVAHSGEAGLEFARQRRPDLVLLDIMMPRLSGLEVLQRLRAADAHLPIILLTARDGPADQVRGLEGGADDYVVKPFEFEVLLARVRALLRRQEADRPDVFRFADLALDTATHQAQRGPREIELTTTEYDLLRQFLEHPRRILPKEFLLDRVWGYDFGGSTNILEVYVKQLRHKLEATGEPRLIHTIRGAGYILRDG